MGEEDGRGRSGHRLAGASSPERAAQISTRPSTSATEKVAASPLTEGIKSDPEPVEKQQRRSFSAEEKRAIVMEAERPGATVSSVARAHGIVTSVLFRWRAELGFGKSARAKLAGVTVNNHASGHGAQQVVLHNILPLPDGMMTVELADGRRVFAPEGSDVEDVRRRATTLGEA